MMKRPHRESGRGATVIRQADDRQPTAELSEAQPPTTRQKRWQQAHPKARWAHGCLQSAIRRGLVERQPCAVCGHERVDGHHPDYDRPADVVWLCRKHHKAAHRAQKVAQ